jgi:hypothetical protein
MKAFLASLLCALLAVAAYPDQPTKEELKNADRTIVIRHGVRPLLTLIDTKSD